MPEVLGKGVADESIYGEWSRATHHASGEAGYIQPVDLVSRQRGYTGRARPTPFDLWSIIADAGPLTIQHRYLMTQRDELKLQFCAAAKPPTEPRHQHREKFEHAGEIMDHRAKLPDFPTILEFSVGTATERNRQTFLTF
jgi:hypothetical protein